MKKNNVEVLLMPHTPFLRYDGKFDKEAAIEYSAKIAGECYEPDGWSKLINEDEKKTEIRERLTLGLEHTTPYEHINIGMEISNMPKILAMVLNNERQSTSSEKPAHYTKIDSYNDQNISVMEAALYNKWLDIFIGKINEQYGDVFESSKIKILAEENARYMVSVFATTRMIHTVPWIQLNRICNYMQDFKFKGNKTEFDKRLIEVFNQFINRLDELNILDIKAMSNKKNRQLSIFGDEKIEENFGSSYSTNYKGSLAQFAQAHRHRTLEYNMQFLKEKEYYVPPILKDDPALVLEWLEDMDSVKDITPQGELVSINESGTYNKFILKIKERLCTTSQLEIMEQTRDTLLKYKKSLEANKHLLAEDISKYSRGAQCTFPDYTCDQDCKFLEGKRLVRKI